MTDSIIKFLGSKLRITKQMIVNGNLDEESMSFYQSRRLVLESLIKEYLNDEGGLLMEFEDA